jgi:hypothetical protein
MMAFYVKAVIKMNLQTTKHILSRTSEKRKCVSRWEFKWLVFVKYVATWGVSFLIFFFMACVSTIIKSNQVEDAFYYTIQNNSTLSLLLSLLFSSFVELFWEDDRGKNLAIPKKIITGFSFVSVCVLFLIYNTFEVLQFTKPDSILFDFQYKINIAFCITVLFVSLLEFIVLSFNKKY